MTTYADIRHELDTGDLVLFRGAGRVFSRIIQRATRCGLVARGHGDAPAGVRLTCALWESTGLGGRCPGPHARARHARGCAARAAQRAGAQPARAPSRCGELDRGYPRARTRGQSADGRLRRELRGRPYEQSLVALARAAYDGPGGANAEDLSSLFCSELVAEAYQRLGLLGDDIASSEFTPSDFAAHSPLTLLRGTLGDEIVLSA